MEIIERISREGLYMGIALLNSLRATCKRGKVGAVLTKDSRIIATGYNGAPKGANHCNPTICDLNSTCTNAIHAERNLIYFCAKNGIVTEGTTLYCTVAPCYGCSEAILQAGISTVYYHKPYKDTEGIGLLIRNSIKVTHYEINEDEVCNLLKRG